ncbi:MAG: hypothetical protein JRJ42_00180 [Deltaproteobacteria bacterium]|nr:hypothetical protein [Deltaproteobacteria bacterium]MBW2018415.1 hypothetical protein [Deltaproteobacteria bacterium]MBW2073702.1 hypothetical protein [Deltaproteobacteria bacterium]RLB83576.1 MAG: hypothetical protein DRH17_01475 [Deltaproteobacteria bacterium]
MSQSVHGLRRVAVFIFLVLISGGLCLLACVPREQAPTAKPLGVLNIRTLLVVPFNSIAERYEIGTTVRCPLCGTVFVTGPVASGADCEMTKQLLTFLKAKTAYTLIPPGMGEGVRSKILSESGHLSERDLLVEMGRRVKADAVVSGTIYRFRQRIGTGFSADTPASVAFGIHLVRVADGRLIWTQHFDETQQSLSENLFKFSAFVQSGGAWLTAEELARMGLNKVMATFPVP